MFCCPQDDDELSLALSTMTKQTTATLEQQQYHRPIEEAEEEYTNLTKLTIDKTRSFITTRQVTPEDKSKLVQILHLISPTMSEGYDSNAAAEAVPESIVVVENGEETHADKKSIEQINNEAVAAAVTPTKTTEDKSSSTTETDPTKIESTSDNMEEDVEDDSFMYIQFDSTSPKLCISMPKNSETINVWRMNDADMSCEFFAQDSPLSSFIERIKEMAQQDILVYSFEAKCQSFNYSVSIVAGSVSVIKEEELQVFDGGMKLGAFLEALLRPSSSPGEE